MIENCVGNLSLLEVSFASDPTSESMAGSDFHDWFTFSLQVHRMIVGNQE